MNPLAKLAIAALIVAGVFVLVAMLPQAWRHRSMPIIAATGVFCLLLKK